MPPSLVVEVGHVLVDFLQVLVRRLVLENLFCTATDFLFELEGFFLLSFREACVGGAFSQGQNGNSQRRK